MEKRLGAAYRLHVIVENTMGVPIIAPEYRYYVSVLVEVHIVKYG